MSNGLERFAQAWEEPETDKTLHGMYGMAYDDLMTLIDLAKKAEHPVDFEAPPEDAGLTEEELNTFEELTERINQAGELMRKALIETKEGVMVHKYDFNQLTEKERKFLYQGAKDTNKHGTTTPIARALKKDDPDPVSGPVKKKYRNDTA